MICWVDVVHLPARHVGAVRGREESGAARAPGELELLRRQGATPGGGHVEAASGELALTDSPEGEARVRPERHKGPVSKQQKYQQQKQQRPGQCL